MFEKGLWRLVEKGLEHDRKQNERAYGWIQETYGGELEVNDGKRLFGCSLAAMGPTERSKVHFDLPHHPFRYQGYRHVHLRKAFVFAVNKRYATVYQKMKDSRETFPWMTGIVWKRPNSKDVAWVVLLKNVVVAQRDEDIADVAHYSVVCEELTEMVPKSLVPVPGWLQA